MSISRQIKLLFVMSLFLLHSAGAIAQDVNALLSRVKAKLGKVNDYVAEGKMKTEVAFIKAPVGRVKVYYKKPDKFKLKRDKGISILPKGGVSFNLNTALLGNNFTAVPSGEALVGATKVKVIRMLPNDQNGDVVLTTLYIDELNAVIRRTNTTTRENGTFDMEMSYGRYLDFALPDKVVFTFNTKDYKIPKGITLDFDTNDLPKQLKNKKGKIEIMYTGYIINKGVSDAEFK